MKHILLVVDCLGWAFHRIALQIDKHLGHRAEFTITARPSEVNGPEWDTVLYFWWRTALKSRGIVQARRTLVALYDEWSRSRHGDEYAEVVGLADGFCVGNLSLAGDLRRLLSGNGVRSKPIYLTEDGVDLAQFTPQPFPERFTVGWAGNRVYEEMGLGDYKGVRLIEYACKRIGVPLLIADKKTSPIPYEEMPERFYRKISCYVCASVAEGTPNPVLEALACDRPVLSTLVGIVPHLSVFSGVRWISRDGEVIAKSLAAVRREEQQGKRRGGWKDEEERQSWDWSRKVEAFAEAFGI